VNRGQQYERARHMVESLKAQMVFMQGLKAALEEVIVNLDSIGHVGSEKEHAMVAIEEADAHLVALTMALKTAEGVRDALKPPA
jgi:hypothetical protein